MAFRQKGPLFFRSALKRAGVFEYDEDGNKFRIPYEEGVKKANQYKNIQFTNQDLIKALESGDLDEFNHPNEQESVKRIISNTTKKMETMPSDELLFDKVRQEFVDKNKTRELEQPAPPPPNINRKVMKDGGRNSYHIQQPDGTSKKGTGNWRPR
tara:strand:- start:812 stop:1276 length:465 start_codon:yes stop_codon:yes gene_type:complete